MTPTYKYYKEVFRGRQMPFAFVDLDLFDENIRQVAARARGKQIRVASKSLRCIELLKRTLQAGSPYQGVMTYSGPETVWLSQKGFDDLLLGYPIWHPQQIEDICGEVKKGKSIILMVDLKEHVIHLNEVGKKCSTVIPVCMDIDMTSVFLGMRFGVWRSSITHVNPALELYKTIQDLPFVKLVGLMGYEAAIAGVGDKMKGKFLQNAAVRFFKNKSAKEISIRRAEITEVLKKYGAQLRFVNGGGTGSLEWTTLEDTVTEVTVGSGLYFSALFDNYSNFRHLPAAAFAVEIVRHPAENIYTCLGGGYIASGSAGADKQPKPYLPEGFKLIPNEGAGEVQTPISYQGAEKLHPGDPVFFRHAKAGELCERFNSLLMVSRGKVTDEALTYRGEGKSFL
ncbi:MAG TPA: amino acid deaminase/aldolase [Chitinophagales bacterium]|nr:amino acid deaminase/aldolase [Chitinophagales bacterium]